jgi:hypothetical protein
MNLTTLAVIAIGQVVVRAPTEDSGWFHGFDAKSVAEEFEPTTWQEMHAWPIERTPTDAPLYTSQDVQLSRTDWLRAEVDSYRALPLGWDGTGSKPPPDDALVGALKLIDQLPAGLLPPKAMIGADGEVGFYWKTDALFADIVIHGQDTLSFFFRSRNQGNAEIFEAAMPITGASMARIKEVLEKN